METRQARKRKHDKDELDVIYDCLDYLVEVYQGDIPAVMVLPYEVAQHIIQFLPLRDRLRLLGTCRTWKSHVESSKSWRVIRPGRKANITLKDVYRWAWYCDYQVRCLDLTHAQINICKTFKRDDKVSINFTELLKEIGSTLQVLKLPRIDNGASKRCLEAICTYCKDLRHLYLNTSREMNDKILMDIVAFNKELVSIYFYCRRWAITVKGLKDLSAKCVNLQKLGITYKRNTELLEVICDVNNFPNLHELTFHKCHFVPYNETVSPLCKRLNNLTSLEIYNCDLRFFDEVMDEMMSLSINLKKSAIVNCTYISEKGIDKMACKGRSLQEVFLDGFDGKNLRRDYPITDDSLVSIATKSSTITHIYVGRKWDVTLQGIQTIASVRPLNLEIIDDHPIKTELEEQGQYRTENGFKINELSISFVEDFFENYDIHNSTW